MAVVIPCRNEAAHVTAVLDCVFAQDLCPHEVVVVDGGSADATMQLVSDYARRYPDLPLRIVDGRGVGIPTALNRGIAAARSEVIVRMDGHSRPARDYVRHCVSALRETKAAVVGGVWRIRPGATGDVASAIASVLAHPLGAGNAAYRLPSTWNKGPRTADTVPFGCFRKAHWEAMGGFNEQLLTNEDYEFYYRSRLAGHAVVLDPSIHCDYFARSTFLALGRQYFRYGWWKGRMLRQHPRSIRLRQLIPALFLPAWFLMIVAALLVAPLQPFVGVAVLAYASALLVSGIAVARGRARLAAFAIVAFATIHSAWSAGLTSYVLSGARSRAGYGPWVDRVRRALDARMYVKPAYQPSEVDSPR